MATEDLHERTRPWARPRAGGGHENRKIALLIAILALVLTFAEILGKTAQTNALSHNIEAANLWAFFPAKTIRMTTVRTAAENAEAQLSLTADPRAQESVQKRINDWKKTAGRYDSEPETREVRKELSARAKVSEERRDRALAAYPTTSSPRARARSPSCSPPRRSSPRLSARLAGGRPRHRRADLLRHRAPRAHGRSPVLYGGMTPAIEAAARADVAR
jgi:Domain of unknown function (DUF4337)